MQLKATRVRLQDGLAERIDALVGPNRRAIFIRDAVEREVRRRERKAEKEKR
jgi:predicted transcriptional regulator